VQCTVCTYSIQSINKILQFQSRSQTAVHLVSSRQTGTATNILRALLAAAGKDIRLKADGVSVTMCACECEPVWLCDCVSDAWSHKCWSLYLLLLWHFTPPNVNRCEVKYSRQRYQAVPT